MKKVYEITRKDLIKSKRKYRILIRMGRYFPQIRKWFRWYCIKTTINGVHLEKELFDADECNTEREAVDILLGIEAIVRIKNEYIYF